MRRDFISVSIVGVVRALASALRRARARLTRPGWIPADLAGSRLVFAEKTFSIDLPIKLTARVDRAYYDGIAITLMELKTRYAKRVHASDIIELSAQRLAVQGSTGERAYNFGYIVLQHPVTSRRTTHKVSLLSQEDVIGIAVRRRLVMQEALFPRNVDDTRCCLRCEYLAECRNAFPLKSGGSE